MRGADGADPQEDDEDVHERRRLERRLREKETAYQDVISLSFIFVCFHARTKTVVVKCRLTAHIKTILYGFSLFKNVQNLNIQHFSGAYFYNAYPVHVIYKTI